MSIKILGQLDGNGANQAAYTVPSSTESVCNVVICNKTSAIQAVSLAISTSTSPSAGQWFHYS